MPSSEALPPPASPPVSAMLMPILIGGCWATTLEVSPTVATATVPPRNVLRFIDSPRLSRFVGRILEEWRGHHNGKAPSPLLVESRHAQTSGTLHPVLPTPYSFKFVSMPSGSPAASLESR